MDEPFRRRLLGENPGLEIVDIYGSAEVGRIAAAHACRDGLHVEEDALHVELLDGGKPVERGALGTVTITAFGQRAMPFIRYEQGDLCRERLDPSACGRPTARLDPPLGRIMNMLTLPDGRPRLVGRARRRAARGDRPAPVPLRADEPPARARRTLLSRAAAHGALRRDARGTAGAQLPGDRVRDRGDARVPDGGDQVQDLRLGTGRRHACDVPRIRRGRLPDDREALRRRTRAR